MANIISGDTTKGIKGVGELALRISRFDSYRLFTLYENVKERKVMNVSGNQKYYLVFRSPKKEIRIPEYDPKGFFEVDNGTYTVDSLSAVLVVRTGKKEYKTTDNVKISCDPPSGTELNIYIDCFWSGELSGYYLDRDKKPRDGEANLYISLPNKLMYMLKLNLNELKGTNDCCPATET